MMNTMTETTRPAASVLHANPVLSRLGRVKESSCENTASYAGIAAKTAFFLLATMVGVMAQLIVMSLLSGEPVLESIRIYDTFTLTLSAKETMIAGAVLIIGGICHLTAIFLRGTVPVTGTLYSVSQGYVISFIVFKVLKGYEFLGLEALLLTVCVIAAMSWLYASGIVKPTKKFHIVLFSLLIGTVGVAVMSMLGMLLPMARPFVQAMMNNPMLTAVLDIFGLVIASLFLISDFSMIDTCVKEGLPKRYEWSAAFGLVFTVLWIYLKILDLLMMFARKEGGSK